MVECPLWGTGGHGFDPGRRHTKVVKKGTSCSSLGTQDLRRSARTGRPSFWIMWLGVISCQMSGAWYFSSTIKRSIELPVATRHRRDMTEILFKATLNPNKQQLLDDGTSNVWIMSHCDQTIAFKLNVGQSDLCFMLKWFCFISWRLFDGRSHTFE